MSELTYGRSNTEYSLQYLRDLQEGANVLTLHENRSFPEMPLVAGVSLGVIEVFSGVSLTYDLKRKNPFAGIEGFLHQAARCIRDGWAAWVSISAKCCLTSGTQEFSGTLCDHRRLPDLKPEQDNLFY